MLVVGGMWKYLRELLTVYETPVHVQIRSSLLAVTYVSIVIVVWVAYLGSLELDLRRIYQKSCPVEGVTLSKVKGIVSTLHLNLSAIRDRNPQLYRRVWDISDLVFPSHGEGGSETSFTIATNVRITANQSRGACSSAGTTANRTLTGSSDGGGCRDDADCADRQQQGGISPGGRLLSRCVQGKYCEMVGWCPEEEPGLPLESSALFSPSASNLTIMVKSSVEFPACGQFTHRRNIRGNATRNYLATCRHGDNGDNNCPVFRLGDIVRWSGEQFDRVARRGGVFRLEIRWDCDFDRDIERCFPRYLFRRIDQKAEKISPGWNFRHAFYHEENRRTLVKVYGLKILVVVTGEGKKFDFLQLILTMGATIGLFSVAPLCCDSLFSLLCWVKRLGGPFGKLFGDLSIKSKIVKANNQLGNNHCYCNNCCGLPKTNSKSGTVIANSHVAKQGIAETAANNGGRGKEAPGGSAAGEIPVGSNCSQMSGDYGNQNSSTTKL